MNRASRIAGTPGGEGDFRVPSETQAGVWYYVTYSTDRGLTKCRCLGRRYNPTCRHEVAVWELVLLERAAETARRMVPGAVT